MNHAAICLSLAAFLALCFSFHAFRIKRFELAIFEAFWAGFLFALYLVKVV